MHVAIIGWGSLLWDPRDLPQEGTWQEGGPRLPLEFSRVSRDGRLTLVIDYEQGATVETYYVLSPRLDLNEVIADLRRREGATERGIGFVDVRRQRRSAENWPGHSRTCEEVRWWLKRADLDAAVWTALSPNFQKKTGRAFSVENAVWYLRSLSHSVREVAITYIRNAPREVDTPLRRRLLELGWIEQYGRRERNP